MEVLKNTKNYSITLENTKKEENKMEFEKMKIITELIDKELLHGQYINLPVHKKVLIAQMVDKIEKIILGGK